jgi:hypothetical protein
MEKVFLELISYRCCTMPDDTKAVLRRLHYNTLMRTFNHERIAWVRPHSKFVYKPTGVRLHRYLNSDDCHVMKNTSSCYMWVTLGESSDLVYLDF